MEDLTKITIDVQDGVASITNLTIEQAQEIWDRCAAVEGTKRFSRKELYDYLQYFAYHNHFGGDDTIKSCASHEKYQEFLKDAKVHCGDCTQVACSCTRCQLQMLEVEAQNTLDMMMGKSEGHCGKKCITECEGVKDVKKEEIL